MKKFLTKKHILILLIFSVIFFGLYNYLNFTIPHIYNSPDETATYVFIGQVIEETSLRYALPFDYGTLSEFIHPRSTYVTEGIGTDILPVGFWYMMAMYGLVGKLIGLYGTLFITPLLAVLAAWCVYGLVKKIWNEHVALISSVLFLLQPVVWYYTTRSLFPNVPFVALMIIGVWMLITKPFKKHTWLNDIVGMFIFMSGVLIRPNEIPWIALSFLFVMLYWRKKISFVRLLSWTIVGIVMIGMYAWVNQIIYSDVVGSYIVSRSVQIPRWYHVLFPFGIDVMMMLKTAWFYGLKMFWWYMIPAIGGVVLFVYDWKQGRATRKQKTLFFLSIIVGLYLWIYYGSNQDGLYHMKTIGVAYVRYWLPLFALVIPFVAVFWESFFYIVVRKSSKSMVAIFVCIIITAYSFLGWQVVYGGIDGIFATKSHMELGENVRNWVLAETEPHAILISDSTDKFFWPAREVMVKFDNPRVRQAVPQLLEKDFPVYYFSGTLSEERFDELHAYYEPFDVVLEEVKIFEYYTLYRFVSIDLD